MQLKAGNKTDQMMTLCSLKALTVAIESKAGDKDDDSLFVESFNRKMKISYKKELLMRHLKILDPGICQVTFLQLVTTYYETGVQNLISV